MDALTLAALAAAKKGGGGGGADSTLNIELSMAQVQLIPLVKDQVDEFFTAEQTAAIVSNTKPHIRLFNDEVEVEIVFEKQYTVGGLTGYSSVGIFYNFIILKLVNDEITLVNVGELGNEGGGGSVYAHYINIGTLENSYSRYRCCFVIFNNSANPICTTKGNIMKQISTDINAPTAAIQTEAPHNGVILYGNASSSLYAKTSTETSWTRFNAYFNNWHENIVKVSE